MSALLKTTDYELACTSPAIPELSRTDGYFASDLGHIPAGPRPELEISLAGLIPTDYTTTRATLHAFSTEIAFIGDGFGQIDLGNLDDWSGARRT